MFVVRRLFHLFQNTLIINIQICDPFISYNNLGSQTNSSAAVDAAIYSDSVADVDTGDCFMVHHVVAPFRNMKTYQNFCFKQFGYFLFWKHCEHHDVKFLLRVSYFF